MCSAEVSAGNGHAIVTKLSCRSRGPVRHTVVLCSLVANVCSVEVMSPDETTIQLAGKSGVDDRFSVLGAHVFSGRSSRTVPFDT